VDLDDVAERYVHQFEDVFARTRVVA